MSFIPVPDAAYASIGFSFAGQTFSNGFWCTKQGYGSTEQDDLASALDVAVDTAVLGGLSDHVHYDQVRVYDMRSATGPISVANTNAGNGTLATPPVPINCAVVVSYYSNARGRSGRGRLYVTGLDENAIEDGAWLQTAANGVLAFVAAYKSAIESAGFTWVVCSRYTNKAPRTTGVTYPVLTYNVRSLLTGTQRRRVDRP